MNQANAPKKVLIMTVPFGGGHHATALKIADLLRSRDPSLDIQILDVITDGWPAYARWTSQAYQDSTGKNGAFWFKVYYRLTDTFPAPLQWFASIAFGRYAKRKLREIQPDLIIATFPFLGHVAWRARTSLGKHMPIVTVITDAGRVQGIWLNGNEDSILAATPDTVGYAAQRRLGGERVRFVGFPVNQAFYDMPDRMMARSRLELQPDVFTVLVTSGGLGMSADRVVSLVRRLSLITTPLQIICVAGKNDSLKREFEAIEFAPTVRTHIIGYSDDMPLLMAASDLICSKSGWLTISEALAAKRPLFLFDAIPGHEEQNAAYVTGGGYGILERDPVVLSGKIADIASNPELLRPYVIALSQRDDRTAGSALVSYFVDLLHERPV